MPFVGGAGSFEGRDSDKPNRVSCSEFYHPNLNCQATWISNFLPTFEFTAQPPADEQIITLLSEIASPWSKIFSRFSDLWNASKLTCNFEVISN